MNAGLVVCVDAGRVSLQVAPESAGSRRELGAVAWAVLETLALNGAVDEAGRWMARSNARDLGQRLGIGKDRAAVALGGLRRAGLIVSHAGRDTRSARFTPSRYEVRLPLSSANDTTETVDVAAATPQIRSSARRVRANSDSLHLFTNI